MFTSAQASESGLSQGQVIYRLRSGLWLPVAGRGLVLDGSPVGIEQGAWAMELTWPGAVLWGASAMRLTMPRAPLPRTGVVIAASSRNRAPAANLRLARREACRAQSEDWHGVQVQSAPWAMIEALRTLDQRSADSLFAWLITRHLIPADFGEGVESFAGRRGFKRLAMYAEYHASGAAAESEMLLHNGLRARGIVEWRANAAVRFPDGTTINVDLLFPEVRLAVEIDGFSYHSGRTAFETDRERDRRLTRAGYKVLRFTWRDLTERLDHTISEIAFHLE